MRPTRAARDRPDEPSLRSIVRGGTGRLLVALLLTEFAVAFQIMAVSTVLPLAADELDGRALFGAVTMAGVLSMVVVLALGGGVRLPLGPRGILLVATSASVVGTVVVVTAGSMEVLLVGSLVRGLASGLLAGFGMTVLGALLDDAARPRVMRLFAVVWLLPAVVGPVVNGFVAAQVGWRWALGWTVLLVVGARLLMWRDVASVPWRATGARPDVRPRLVVAAGLALTMLAPSLGAGWRTAVFVAGLVLVVLPAGRVLDQAVPGDRSRTLLMVVYCLTSVLFMGAEGLLSVTTIEHLGSDVRVAAVVVGAAAGGWALTGLPGVDPGRRTRDPVVAGLLLVTAGILVVLAVVVTTPGPAAPWLLGLGSLVIGLGTGTAYPHLSSATVAALPPDRVSTVATVVVLAELAATGVGTALGPGGYSLLVSTGGGGSAPYVVPYAVLAVVAVGSVLAARRLRRPQVVPAPADRVSG